VGIESVKPKLIIVDDETLICEIYSEYFSQNGFDVFSANSTTEAIKIIKAKNPDVILSDVVMPVQDGFDLFEKVQLYNPNISFVFMTGYERDKRILKRLAEIDKKCITKPIRLDELLELIKSEIKR
jgi:DNA-binding NtrC family response regulator